MLNIRMHSKVRRLDMRPGFLQMFLQVAEAAKRKTDEELKRVRAEAVASAEQAAAQSKPESESAAAGNKPAENSVQQSSASSEEPASRPAAAKQHPLPFEGEAAKLSASKEAGSEAPAKVL